MGSSPIGSSRKPLQNKGFSIFECFAVLLISVQKMSRLDTFGAQKMDTFTGQGSRQNGRQQDEAEVVDSKSPSRLFRSSGLRVWPDWAKTVMGASVDSIGAPYSLFARRARRRETAVNIPISNIVGFIREALPEPRERNA
jgi:hypothetical protein